MIEPALADDAFLADVSAARKERGALHAWWLGQSGFLLAWSGRHVLLDPYLSDSLTVKYAHTERPHVRMSRRVVDPARLGFVDLVTSSHVHTDHLDAETLGAVLDASGDPELLVPEANRAFVAERLGVRPDWPVGIDDGGTVRFGDVGDLSVSAVASAHEELEQDEQGRSRYLGYVVRLGPWTVYHSGDTLWWPGLAERLQSFQLDLALLPINGRDPARGVAGNLDGAEAARLAAVAGAGLVVPCHYDMFTFNTASTDTFETEARRLGQAYRVLRLGERLTLR